MTALEGHNIRLVAAIVLGLLAPSTQRVKLFSPDFEKELLTLCSKPDDKLANDIFTRLFQELESVKSFREEKASRAHTILWLVDTNCGLDAVLEASRSKDYKVRQLAVGLLARTEDPRALSRLIEMFKDPAKGFDEEKILAAAREEDIQKSIQQLSESYVRAMRDEILRVFAPCADERITKLLLERFESASGKEKIRTGYMLSRRMGLDALALVMPLLEDKEYDNSVVLGILSNIGGEQVEQLLLNALDNGYSLYTVIQCLQRMGTEKSVPALARALERPMHENARILIIRMLGRIGSDEAVDIIAADLTTEKYRYRAVNALGQTGNPRAVKAIMNLLGEKELEKNWARSAPHRKYGLTAACVHALSSLGAQVAIPTLKTFLGCESHEVRLETFASLAKLEDVKWLERCIHLLIWKERSFRIWRRRHIWIRPKNQRKGKGV